MGSHASCIAFTRRLAPMVPGADGLQVAVTVVIASLAVVDIGGLVSAPAAIPHGDFATIPRLA
jgi:hypothetical protein